MSMSFKNNTYREKYTILKILLIIILLSADVAKTTGIANTSFYFVIILSSVLILLYNLSTNRLKLKFIKSEFPIYSSIFVISTFILLYSPGIKSLIHVLKLFIIFYVIYPTIRSYFTANQIIVALKINLIINFTMIILGLLGIEFVSRLTGNLRGSTLLNYAGSLYKVALIIIPYLFWDLINIKKNKFMNLILIIICLYIISYDGSRTGIFSLIILLLLFIVFLSITFMKKARITYSSLFYNTVILLTLAVVAVSNYEKIVHSNAFIRAFDTIKLLVNASNIHEFLIKGDSLRGYMIIDAIKTIKSNYLFFGNGFQSTKTSETVIHNAYLQIFADLGIIPAFNLIILIFYPIVLGVKKMKNNISVFPSVVVLILFSFSLLLHPFTVQVSDWALYIIPLSLMMILLSENALTTNN
ncbi:O-antigen ligase family protein [Tepidanaerobacter sp. GT38]|uniref:O-antigen ligase family protein n=1 Tax=Tepidanaerobacter sp. GT38 TaxID=2722793 RepID=UPI001F336F88|nr:O-antigen ligase family protein [Tepidanaerobacter sp. GT38]MCG1011516.1 O-antigen ligase family protein [Tepidanaerobacter sp. GT38]